MPVSTVIFDFGGVISSPLFVGIGAFEEAEGYPSGSLLRLMFGETHYIGVEGRAVADALGADPDAAENEGEIEDEPDWHLLEKGQLDMATYFDRVVEKARRRCSDARSTWTRTDASGARPHPACTGWSCTRCASSKTAGCASDC